MKMLAGRRIKESMHKGRPHREGGGAQKQTYKGRLRGCSSVDHYQMRTKGGGSQQEEKFSK